MNCDSDGLQRAKAILRSAENLPGIKFRGIPVEADVFDFDDLLAMLSISLDTARQERAGHDAAMGVVRGVPRRDTAAL